MAECNDEECNDEDDEEDDECEDEISEACASECASESENPFAESFRASPDAMGEIRTPPTVTRDAAEVAGGAGTSSPIRFFIS